MGWRCMQMKTDHYSLDQEKALQRYAQEATLTRKVKEHLTKRGIFHKKISDRYTKGISDIIAIVNGLFVGIELKADKGVPSPQQKLFAKQVIKAGGIAGICYSIHDVDILIDEAIKRTI